jgi:hypothetical protein
MKNPVYFFTGRSISRIILILGMLFSLSGLAQTVSASDAVKFNPDFKLKRVSGTTVAVYTIHDGNKHEYVFADFNADVLLLLYRKVGIDLITDNLTKKYHLSEIDCRRQVKMALNTLAEWEIILRS